MFVDVGMGIDGLVHISDISWNKKVANPAEKYKKGDKLKAVVLGIDKQAEKFSLGIKQLERDPWEQLRQSYPPQRRLTRTAAMQAECDAFGTHQE